MNRAVRMSPNNPKLYYHRAALFLAMGSPERAIQDYGEAIRLDPQHVDAYRSRSLMYTLIGRNEEAQQDLDQAVRLGADRANLEREAGDLRRRR
jgi:tetratricopeptide (TPR) repeat protein